MWKINFLGVCFCKVPRPFVMYFFSCVYRFIQNDDRPMATHNLGNVVFNHVPFCLQAFYWTFCACWRSIVVVVLLYPFSKHHWFSSIFNPKVLWNMDIGLAKLVIFFSNKILLYFILYLLLQEAHYLLQEMHKVLEVGKMHWQSCVMPLLFPFDVKNGQILIMMNFSILCKSVGIKQKIHEVCRPYSRWRHWWGFNFWVFFPSHGSLPLVFIVFFWRCSKGAST